MSLSGKDIYDGEFSRRAPILRKAAQHFESIFGVLIKLKSLVCYFLRCKGTNNILILQENIAKKSKQEKVSWNILI